MSIKIPTNIENDGAKLDDKGDVEGYAEEFQNIESRFFQDIDMTQDEERKIRIEKKQGERRKSRKEAK